MSLYLRSANFDDLDILAIMNKQLIEDENSSNPMGIDELKIRMNEFLQNSWQVELIINSLDVIGYVLYQFREGQSGAPKHVYIRQNFIKREERNKGYGQTGIHLLKETRFKEIESIGIDVLEANPSGRAFWDKAGFKPYYINMRLEN